MEQIVNIVGFWFLLLSSVSVLHFIIRRKWLLRLLSRLLLVLQLISETVYSLLSLSLLLSLYMSLVFDHFVYYCYFLGLVLILGPFSQRVLLTLEEKKIPYKLHLIDLSNKPNGKVLNFNVPLCLFILIAISKLLFLLLVGF